MAIWTPTEGGDTNAGAAGGVLFKGGTTGSRVIQAKVATANPEARAGFAQWGRLSFWLQEWEALSAGAKSDWVSFAQANPDYGLTGRAEIKPGREHFAAYFNRLELMSGTTPTAPFDTPEPSPSWTSPKSPFEPFLVGSPSFAMVLSTTLAEPVTLFLAVRQPSLGRGRMARSTQRPLGSYTFATMTAGDHFTSACEDAAARFGAVADAQNVQQWFTVWQAIGGYARTLLDPCWSPPPPDFANSYVLTIQADGYTTKVRTLNRDGALLEWNSADGEANLVGQDLENGLFNWLAQGTVNEPSQISTQAQLEGTAQPEGAYGNYVYPFTSVVVS